MKLYVALASLACTLSTVSCQKDTVSSKKDTASRQEAKVVAPEGYRLVWSDEFNVDGPPDPKSWGYEEGLVRNKEAQLFTRENAFCESGLLILEARRETVANPNHDPKSKDWRRSRSEAQYTSASLLTKGKHAWTYGRFEIRGRIDTRTGLWPAFWTLGSAREWPSCGEVDIMEFYRGKLLANACWGTKRRWVPAWDSERTPITDPEWSKQFHVWRMDWDKKTIRLYVDDKLLNTIELEKTVNPDAERSNPFHEPQYMLLTLAIGGTNGGDPKGTKFPARVEVDYVRVFQRTED
ncbi:MAG: glycoside hydrolase family 16 protein [Planctomycetota bacterium]